ncbi:copper chaperone [Streptomyces sp. Act143]|uniref:heavy-metal-associated domain-containing protein n=1 Tax=Streptomyces sp. Act143 TaxID=2200760 RepID=UPI000D67F89C|nr:heavy-metal-associated domain-containing protein [Streptomyces sp. Act143]PWI16894.1 copper chaperone [Streptomyces sp. Act143]
MSGCCTPGGSCHASTANTVVYKVEGIGSAHCQGVVTDAVSALDGVTAVTVEIGTGLVTVTTAAEADEAFDALIAANVDEAGYDFAGRVPA